MERLIYYIGDISSYWNGQNNLGDYLVVAISTDEFNLQKQKKAYHSYEHRKLILETIRYVDEVIPEKTGSKGTRCDRS